MENNGERNIGTDVPQAINEDELNDVTGGKTQSPYLKNECKICGAVFRNAKELKAHQRAMHPNDPRIKW